jgi:hypothetical protein
VRTKVIIVVLIAVVAAIAISVTGQEEPLPVVHPRGNELGSVPRVFLESEPVVTLPVPTLADAARANDFVTFDALYRAAQRRGEPVAAFATLHDLWSWSLSDPVGAFYSRGIHDRLARAYPGFSRYIEDYAIVDSHGDVFYPTSETRTFLLTRALEGGAPIVRIAENNTRNANATNADAPRTPSRTTSSHASARAAKTTAVKSPARVPAKAPATISEPKPVITEPAFVVKADSAQTTNETPVAPTSPQPPAVAEPAAASPVVSAPVASTPVATTPVVTTPVASSQPSPAPAVPAESAFQRRGLLLLVIGLVGVGLLAVILRTPSQEPMTILSAPGVEPFRKTPAPGSVKVVKTEEQEKPRATGSHG